MWITQIMHKFHYVWIMCGLCVDYVWIMCGLLVIHSLHLASNLAVSPFQGVKLGPGLRIHYVQVTSSKVDGACTLALNPIGRVNQSQK